MQSKTSDFAQDSAALQCSCSRAPLSGMKSLKAVPATCHPSRWRMHLSTTDGRPECASSKLSANQLVARVCCLQGLTVRAIVIFCPISLKYKSQSPNKLHLYIATAMYNTHHCMLQEVLHALPFASE